jgi:hypothetical protein
MRRRKTSAQLSHKNSEHRAQCLAEYVKEEKLGLVEVVSIAVAPQQKRFDRPPSRS